MFGFLRTIREAKAAQRALTEAFRARGHDFMTLNSVVHEAMVREAAATGVDATLEHFDRVESVTFGNADSIVRHYRERAQQFGR